MRAWLVGLLCAWSIGLAGAAVPAILLANVYREQVDVAQYMVSEKLDGVRAIWDGRELRFRSGRLVHAPDWFLAALPQESLDGELWIGRGQFERVSGVVRQERPDDAAWRSVRYMIFELPGAPGTFRERAERIKSLVRQANVPWLCAIEQKFPFPRDRLKSYLAEVVKAGGEGLMLHRADAVYETGRSDTLLKVKPWLDTEAEVVGHQPGRGRYAGMLGALRVRTPDGKVFLLGTGFSEAQRREPPPVGAMVTYRYRELTSRGLPRFASFLRVREEP